MGFFPHKGHFHKALLGSDWQTGELEVGQSILWLDRKEEVCKCDEGQKA